MKLFINGVETASSTDSALRNLSSPTLEIGRRSYVAGNNLAGHIDDFRITKGTARYTVNFTVPTETFPTTATGGAILGTHTVTYTATDAASNQAQATRNSKRCSDLPQSR